jgi:hypothetical protein
VAHVVRDEHEELARLVRGDPRHWSADTAMLAAVDRHRARNTAERLAIPPEEACARWAAVAEAARRLERVTASSRAVERNQDVIDAIPSSWHPRRPR